MTEPKRIQLRRTKGWRKPEGAIVVSRPSRWGNPFTVGGLVREPGYWKAPCAHALYQGIPGTYEARDICGDAYTYTVRPVIDRPDAVALFRSYIAFENTGQWSEANIRNVLGDHDLACWCPLDQPCHADVLLEVANR